MTEQLGQFWVYGWKHHPDDVRLSATPVRSLLYRMAQVLTGYKGYTHVCVTFVPHLGTEMQLHLYWTDGISRHPYGREPDVKVQVVPNHRVLRQFLYAENIEGYPRLTPLRIVRSRLGWHTYNCVTFVCEILDLPHFVNPNELIQWLESRTTNPAQNVGQRIT